jgi:hypothetical protein
VCLVDKTVGDLVRLDMASAPKANLAPCELLKIDGHDKRIVLLNITYKKRDTLCQ